MKNIPDTTKKNNIKLWHRFAIIITIIVFLYLLILSVFMMLVVRNYGINYRMMPFFVLISMSVTISAILTAVVSHIFVHPIDDISEAMNDVASGNFGIQLSEKDEFQSIEQMNKNFNKMVRELNSTEMLKTDFITNVSHEIKTPIAAIEGYASLLSATQLDEEQQLYTKNIMESASRLSTLTGNILRLSKLENQQFNQKKTIFSLDEQLRQAILMLETSWSAKNLDIEPDLDSVDFYGYEDLLPHVWLNLIGNAVKFTPDGGRISFDLHKCEGGVSIAVTDTGIGMSEEEAAHAFDKFYQADNNHSVAGNGLGLPLVRQIVTMHEGTIKIKSAPGKGSTFEVFLPQTENY